jgi:serine protease inhibitor
MTPEQRSLEMLGRVRAFSNLADFLDGQRNEMSAVAAIMAAADDEGAEERLAAASLAVIQLLNARKALEVWLEQEGQAAADELLLMQVLAQP